MRVLIILLFLSIVTYAHNQCIDIYRKSSTTRAIKNVFITPREEAFEHGQDGTTVINPSLQTWISEHAGFRADIVTDSTTKSSEAMIQFSAVTNASIKNLEFRAKEGFPYRNTLLKSFLYSGRGNSTGMRLKISSWAPNTEITIRIKSSSASLTETYTFIAPTEPTEISIPWKLFKPDYSIKSRAITDPHTKEFIADDTFVFSVKTTQGKLENDSSVKSRFAIRLHGPIVFERDIMNTPPLLAKILNQDYSVAGSMFLNTFLNDRSMDHWPWIADGRTRRSDGEILHKALINLHTRSKQEPIAALSDQEVLRLIEKEGVRTVEFDDKQVNYDAIHFFGAAGPLNSVSEPKGGDPSTSPYLTTGKHRPAIPIEKGEFGQEHSETAHARQLLTMMSGMSVKEKNQLKAIVAGLFGWAQYRWAIWDIIFDAPGNHLPNSPRYWRDIVEEMKSRTSGN